MNKSKLGLDQQKVDKARSLARAIAEDVQSFVEGYTTVAVERTICRLLGIDGVDENQVPLPNVVVDALKGAGVLGQGVMFYIGNAMVATGKTPQQIAEAVADGSLDLTKIGISDKKQVDAALQPVITASIERIRTRRGRREEYLRTLGEGKKPYLYIIVATGNIYEDVVQAEAGARQGADVIAVIRTTGQSRRHLCHPGEFPHHARRPRQGRGGGGPIYPPVQLLLGSLHAGNRHHGCLRGTGRDA